MLCFLSVLALVMAGGIFSHTEELAHQHYHQVSAEKPKAIVDHDHLNTAVQGDNQLEIGRASCRERV